MKQIVGIVALSEAARIQRQNQLGLWLAEALALASGMKFFEARPGLNALLKTPSALLLAASGDSGASHKAGQLDGDHPSSPARSSLHLSARTQGQFHAPIS